MSRMGYKFREPVKMSLKLRLLWTIAFLTTFSLGAIVSAIILLRINKAYGLTGPKAPVQEEMNIEAADVPRLPTPSGETSDGNKQPDPKVLAAASTNTATETRLLGCGVTAPRHGGLNTSSIAQLKKLAEYEAVCEGGLASRVSFFAAMPRSAAEATSQAQWVATVLKEFARTGVAPLVFFEPAGVPIKDLGAGAYDVALSTYFSTLKTQGITDIQMGVWVPIPEGNIPVWGNTDPNDFAGSITKVVQIQKQYFPTSKAAVLLQSMTYPSGTSWAGGSYKSFVPYVQPIPKGLIDSFGLQGFAWPPTSPADVAQLDPKSFLRVDLAAEAARALGVQEVWMNTGTFARSLIVSRTNPYTLSPEQRQNILNGVVAQARTLSGQGFTTSVHLFAEDKAHTAEGIDWSYWPSGQAENSANMGIFKTFVNDLRSANIALWLYDSAD